MSALSTNDFNLGVPIVGDRFVVHSSLIVHLYLMISGYEITKSVGRLCLPVGWWGYGGKKEAGNEYGHLFSYGNI